MKCVVCGRSCRGWDVTVDLEIGPSNVVRGGIHHGNCHDEYRYMSGLEVRPKPIGLMFEIARPARADKKWMSDLKRCGR